MYGFIIFTISRVFFHYGCTHSDRLRYLSKHHRNKILALVSSSNFAEVVSTQSLTVNLSRGHLGGSIALLSHFTVLLHFYSSSPRGSRHPVPYHIHLGWLAFHFPPLMITLNPVRFRGKFVTKSPNFGRYSRLPNHIPELPVSIRMVTGLTPRAIAYTF